MTGEQAQAAPEAATIVVRIARPVHARLTAIKDAQQQQLRRQVTFTEVIEQLLERAS